MPVTAEAGRLVVDLEPRHAVHVDDAGVNELALHVVGQVAREQELAADDRPHALVVENRIHAAAAASCRRRTAANPNAAAAPCRRRRCPGPTA